MCKKYNRRQTAARMGSSPVCFIMPNAALRDTHEKNQTTKNTSWQKV
jgi:hypothetical protein